MTTTAARLTAARRAQLRAIDRNLTRAQSAARAAVAAALRADLPPLAQSCEAVALQVDDLLAWLYKLRLRELQDYDKLEKKQRERKR